MSSSRGTACLQLSKQSRALYGIDWLSDPSAVGLCGRRLSSHARSLASSLVLTDMAVFDALRHLSTYLNEAHTSGKHHLADLYEIVQYAGNILVVSTTP